MLVQATTKIGGVFQPPQKAASDFTIRTITVLRVPLADIGIIATNNKTRVCY
jgi:hypothetical protein